MSVLGRPDLVGPALRRALTETTDRWLADLLDGALAGRPADGLALVAVGAYGRREPAPGSDLDLVLLHAGDRGPAELAEHAERLWYPVWDAGVGLDHAVRTVREAVAVGREDLKAGLGLLDVRHVAGDPCTTRDLVASWRAVWRDEASRRLAELHESSAARAETRGEIAYLLEPDLKDGRGGLRDVAVLDAVAVAQVGNPPRERVRVARELLLDVRGELHRRRTRSSGQAWTTPARSGPGTRAPPSGPRSRALSPGRRRGTRPARTRPARTTPTGCCGRSLPRPGS